MASSNRLKDERSPYLLQHKNNPVHWYPWGPEAFEAAKAQNKLIFLSVGYSTCHWCHVMERESFESQEVADIMNEHFINVKVDREERPDVDKVYMTFVQASTGGGGWPMSVFLTPTLKPVFGGTYFPPEDQMFGRPGFKSILSNLADQWTSNQDKLNLAGDKIVEALGEHNQYAADALELKIGDSTVQKCFGQLVTSYDSNMGGFSKAPKFPQPVNFNFLFRYAAEASSDRRMVLTNGTSGDHSKQALNMVLHTLEMMSKGGIFDHVSKGFARYSTDERWHVPHFEKMLYDQGQLCVAYAHAYQASKDLKFKKVLNEVIEYVSRDLRHGDGGFYSAEDADSLPTPSSDHKKEGAFCVWTDEELSELLPGNVEGTETSKVDVFRAVFGVQAGGNVNPRGDPHGELKGQNVLTRIDCDTEAVVEGMALKDEAQLEAVVEACCQILHQKRQSRPRPHLDDKILTSWNGLMITGLCSAYQALGDVRHLDMAVKAMAFIKATMWNGQKKVLYRSAYRGADDGKIHQLDPPICGFVDDYANTIRALIDLYQVTFDVGHLEWALELQERQNAQFWDPAGKGYFTSAEGDPTIVLRMKESQDGAEPNSNSVSALNLLRLHQLLDKPELMDMAKQTIAAFQETLARFPVALPEMTTALMMVAHSPPQIIVTGQKGDTKTKAMIDAANSVLMPQKTIILADGNTDSILYKNNKVLADIPADKAGMAFFCRDFACKPPVSDPAELIQMLTEK